MSNRVSLQGPLSPTKNVHVACSRYVGWRLALRIPIRFPHLEISHGSSL